MTQDSPTAERLADDSPAIDRHRRGRNCYPSWSRTCVSIAAGYVKSGRTGSTGPTCSKR